MTDNKRLKLAITSALMFFMALSSAGAVEYDFTRSTIDSEALNSNIYFTALNQSADYELVRADGKTVATFTSTSTGVKDVTFDFKPFEDSNLQYLDKNGSTYTLRNSDVSKDVATVYLSPSMHMNRFDTFSDGVVNEDRWEAFYHDGVYGTDSYGYEYPCSGQTTDHRQFSESNNNLYIKDTGYDETACSSVTLNGSTPISVATKFSADVNIRQSYDPDPQETGVAISGTSYAMGLEGTVTVKYNESISEMQIYDEGSLAYSFDYNKSYYRVTPYVISENGLYEDGTTKLWIREYAEVGHGTSEYWNVSDSNEHLEFNPDSQFKARSFDGWLEFSGSPSLQFRDDGGTYTSILDDTSRTGSLDVKNDGNGMTDSLTAETTVVIPPEISGTTFDPEEWTYRSNVNFETTVTDEDGVVDSVKYDVYAGGTKVVDNRSLTQTSNPDVYETTDGFNIEEEGTNYTVEIKAWDNEGYKTVKTYEQEIPPFETEFAFEDLGTWRNKALTPQLNQTGFTLRWTGFNSSKVNYTYAEIDVYLESIDRDLNESGYDVYLANKGDIEFINQSTGNDTVNGTFDYNINFQSLNDYEVTNKILGDRIRVIRVLELKDSNGNTIKRLKVTDDHESLEEQGGFFQAVFDAIGAGLQAVGDFLGVTELVQGIIDTINGLESFIGDIIDSLENALTNLLDSIVESINSLIDLIEAILVEFYIAIAKVLSTVLNAVTLFISYLVNVLQIAVFSIGNYGLEVQGELDESNESFTYYNYTGDYDKRLNETNASQMDLIMLRYDLNVTYSSNEWLQDNNISSTEFNETTIFSFGNVSELRNSTETNNTATITVNSYTKDYDTPDGISWFVIALFTVVSAFTAVLHFVYDALPESIKTGINVVLSIGATIIGIITSMLSGLTWVLNLLFVDGLKWTIMGIKYYVIFKGIFYMKTVGDALGDGGKEPIEAVNIIMNDIKDLYKTVIELSETAFNISDKIFRQALDIVRTIASWIPFI